jgi:chromosomal replication initiation ATPase DnaA
MIEEFFIKLKKEHGIDVTEHWERYKLSLQEDKNEMHAIMFDNALLSASSIMGVSDMRKKSRKREYIIARHLVCKFMYDKSIFSIKKIGLKLGGLHHSTILHGKDNLNNLLSYDKAMIALWYKFLDNMGEERYIDIKVKIKRSDQWIATS